MKAYLSFSFLGLLLACGESQIKSVDDEVLEQASSDRATADLKREETALLGTWQACLPEADNQSTLHEYTFTGDGEALFLRRSFENASCSDASVDAASMSSTWKLVPLVEAPGFNLHFTWDKVHVLKSQYAFAGGEAMLPKIFELKDKSDLALLQLDAKDNFLSLKKLPADGGAAARKQAETMLLDFARGLLGRDGIWQTACVKRQRTTIRFEMTATIQATQTAVHYNDDSCENQKDEAASPVSLTVTGVTDLTQKKLALSLDKDKRKGQLRVFLDNVNKLELSDLISDKASLMALTFQAAGVKP